MPEARSDKVYSENKFYILLAIYVSVWSMMPMLTVKLLPLNLSWLGLGVIGFSYGAFTHALTFPCTDGVAEVWGAKKARLLVFLGTAGYVSAMLIVYLGTLLPPVDFWAEANEGYVSLFSSAMRMVAASLTATVVAQLLDISIFEWIKKRTGSQRLWLRNNLSTMLSQLIDTLIFYSIAFYGIIPLNELPPLVLGTYLVKITVAALDTPAVYLVVRWVTGQWQVKEEPA